MYSIVLATMLTAGSATPAWGHGCFGCWSCSGCYGCGGYGYTGYGWYSGCYGCAGSCSGCYGCGGCYGWCSGCAGCYGCAGSCAGCCGGCYGYVVKPAPTKTALAPAAEAKVVVTVPEDAALYIDEQKSKMTSTRRTFVTPVLASGEKYFYDLKAETLRDGKIQTESRRVVITAGEVAHVDFSNLGAPVAELLPPPKPKVERTTAEVTVRLPEKARLFIDGQPCPLTSSERKFETPTLTPGKLYYYVLVAEIERDGQTLAQSQRVRLRAGKKIAVTFDDFEVPGTHAASR